MDILWVSIVRLKVAGGIQHEERAYSRIGVAGLVPARIEEISAVTDFSVADSANF